MRDYLFCYDIADSKRLYRVRKLVFPLSLGGQKSALKILATKKEAKAVLKKVNKIIDRKVDRINLIEIKNDEIFLGKQIEIDFDEGVIII